MRKITRSIIDSFYRSRENVSYRDQISNSEVLNQTLYLFNNAIAKWDDDCLWICNGNHSTSTTKERLNGLNNVKIYQKNYTWYLNDKEWTEPYSWTSINGYPDYDPGVNKFDYNYDFQRIFKDVFNFYHREVDYSYNINQILAYYNNIHKTNIFNVKDITAYRRDTLLRLINIVNKKGDTI